MPDNYLIVPSADVTNGRITTLANARETSDLALTVAGLPNGVDFTVFRLSYGISGTPMAETLDPTEMTLDDVPFADFPFIAEQDLATVIIPVSGTYTGEAPTGVEVRVKDYDDNSNVTAFLALTDTAISGGTWAGNLTMIPGNGRYRIEVRPTGGATAAGSTLPFRTAGALVAFGQSNMLGFMTNSDPAVTARNDVFIHRRSTLTETLHDPIFEVPTGGGILSVLNGLAAQTGMSWVCIGGGQNATKIREFDNDVNTGGGSTGILDRLRTDIAQFGKLPHLALWHQGEGDAVGVTLGEPFSYYETPFNDIWATIIGDFPGAVASDMPVFVSSLCTHDDGGATVYTAWDLVDSWLLELAETYPQYHWGGSWKDAERADPFHAGGTEHTKRGKRNLQAILAYLGVTPAYTPFQITGATAIDDTTTDVTVSHGQGTDFNVLEVVHFDGTATGNTSVITGFDVASGGAYVPATGLRVDATTIRLTHAALPQTGRTLKHLSGENPDMSGLVVDNSGAAVPLLHTADTPITVADGVASGATFAQQVNGYAVVNKVPTVITPTLTLPGATRFLYGVSFGSKDLSPINLSVNGVAMTPLGSYLLPEVDGAGVASGKECRLVIFETDQVGDLVVDLGTAQNYSTGVSVAIVEAAGVTGAWSILDAQIDTGTDVINGLITHASVTPGDGDLVAGLFNISIQVPGNAWDDAYAGTAEYQGYNGNVALGVATGLGDGTATVYAMETNPATKRSGSVIAGISAA